MKKFLLYFYGGAALFAAGHIAYAIPPPWDLEAMKAQSDVIAIVETTEIKPVEGMDRFNRVVGIKIIKALKTDVPASDSNTVCTVQGDLYFSQPDAPPADRAGIVPVTVGGGDPPKPENKERALVFLKRMKGKNAFSAVCGCRGYIRLSARSEEELRGVLQNLARYHEWSEKIKNEWLRKEMEDCYNQAIAFVHENKGDIRK